MLEIVELWDTCWGELLREWNQLKRKMCVSANKVEWTWRSEEHFNIRHGDSIWSLHPAGFQTCFGPVFPYYTPFPVLEW